MDSKFIRSRCALSGYLGWIEVRASFVLVHVAWTIGARKMYSLFYSTVRHSSCQKHCYGLQLVASKVYNATRGDVSYNASAPVRKGCWL